MGARADEGSGVSSPVVEEAVVGADRGGWEGRAETAVGDGFGQMG